MTYNIEVFLQNHLEEFVPQQEQVEEFAMFRKFGTDGIEWLEHEHNTITVCRNGRTIAIVGIMPTENNGGNVWAFLGCNINGTDLLYATKMILGSFEVLKEQGFAVLQTPVKEDFEQGKRWAKMLGFKPTNNIEDILGNGVQHRYWLKEL